MLLFLTPGGMMVPMAKIIYPHPHLKVSAEPVSADSAFDENTTWIDMDDHVRSVTWTKTEDGITLEIEAFITEEVAQFVRKALQPVAPAQPPALHAYQVLMATSEEPPPEWESKVWFAMCGYLWEAHLVLPPKAPASWQLRTYLPPKRRLLMPWRRKQKHIETWAHSAEMDSLYMMRLVVRDYSTKTKEGQ